MVSKRKQSAPGKAPVRRSSAKARPPLSRRAPTKRAPTNRASTTKVRKQIVYRTKRLYRSSNDKILGGVCGGIGDYFKVDSSLIRIAWLIFSLIYGSGILAYIIAWIIIPRNPRQNWND